MKIKIILSILVCTLLILPIVTSAEHIEKEQKTVISASEEGVPTWSEGNSWTYNIDVTGSVLDILQFEWTFNNLEFKVDEVTSSSYNLKVNGDVTGEISVGDIGIIKGTLEDTTISGDAIYKKSNIGINEFDAQISGNIKLIFKKPFIIDVTLSFIPSYNPIIWPLSVGQQWNLPVSGIEGYLDFTYDGDLIFDNLAIPNVAGGQPAECKAIVAKTVEAGTFDSYKIECDYEDIEFYYSQNVGNFIFLHAVTDDFNIDLNLKSYEYSGGEPGAPNRPSKPSGSTSGKPGTTYSYTSSTTDNEGDQIYYLFDWGDGSDSGWIGPKNSGETCSASHSWSSDGNYKIKVKAKDTQDHESIWSEELSVKMQTSKSKFLNSDSLIFKILQWFLVKFPILGTFLER